MNLFSHAVVSKQQFESTMFRLCSLFAVLLLMHTSAEAQVASKIWSSSAICPQSTDGSISTFATNGTTLAVMSCDLGPIISHDAGRTFEAFMSPTAASALQYAPSLGWLCDDVFLIAGIDNAFSSQGTAFRSTNGGLQWTPYSRADLQDMRFKGVSGQDSWILQHNGTAKFFDLYTTNCGESWISVPMPDSLYRPNNVSVFQLRDGTFAIKSRSPKKWYSVDISSRIYREHWLPGFIERVFRLPDSTVLGIAAFRSSHSFYRSSKADTTLQPFVLNTTDGSILDSTFVGTTTQLLGGAVVLQCPAAPKELFVIDGQSEFTIHRDSIAMNTLAWSTISASDSSSFIVQLLLQGNKIMRVLVDASARRVTVLPSSFWVIRPDVLLTNTGTSIAFEDDGRVLLLDSKSGDILVGGTVEDQFHRAEAIPIEKMVVSKDSRFTLDRLGDVAEFTSDTICKLRGRAIERLVHVGINESMKRTRQFLYGHALIWTGSDGVVVGGAAATLIRRDNTDTVIFDDTTTFFTHSPTGRDYLGSRRPYMRESTKGPFTALGVIGEGRAQLSALVEAGPGILVAGTRGFVRDSAGLVTDTVKGGIWISKDDGGSWSKILVPEGCEFVYSLSYRTMDGTLWASCTQATLLADGIELNDLQLIRTSDLGKTWTVIERIPYHGPWIASDCNITTSDQGFMAWTARDRLLLSSNSGQTWTQLEGLPQPPHVISSAVFSSNGDLQIATSQGYYRFSRPTDVEHDELRRDQVQFLEARIDPQPATSTATLHLPYATNIAGRSFTLQILDNCGGLVGNIEGVLPSSLSHDDFQTPLNLPSMTPGFYHVLGQVAGIIFCTKLVIVQ